LILALGVGVAVLARLFPGRLSQTDSWSAAIGSLAMTALIGARLLSSGLSGGQLARHLAAWVGLGALLLLAFSFKDAWGPLAGRLRSAVIPGYPVAASSGEVMVSREEDGAFYVMGQVDGQPVRFLVDTGASDIVLSPADARRAGADPEALRFDHPVETANGQGFGAPFTVASLKIGPVTLTDVPVSVNQAAMTSSLLGRAFFNRLKSYRFEGDRLYLRP
jgi:aspartyl protease family protein